MERASDGRLLLGWKWEEFELFILLKLGLCRVEAAGDKADPDATERGASGGDSSSDDGDSGSCCSAASCAFRQARPDGKEP